MSERTCEGCGTDISGAPGNTKRCAECRMCSKCHEKPTASHGLCSTCLRYAQRHGETWEQNGPVERFWIKVNRNGPVPPRHPELGPCWLWTAKLQNGYAALFMDGQWLSASQFAYELEVEPIPEGLRLRHICEVRACVNPAHAEIALPVAEQARFRRDISVPMPAAGSAADLAYWGALLDGEGYLGIRKNNQREDRPTGASMYIARLGLGMADRSLVQEFANRFGIKTVYVVEAKRYPERSAKRDIYQVGVAGAPAARIVRQVLPYLNLKRRQAELMIMLEDEKCQPGLRTRYTGTYAYQRGERAVERKKYATGQDHLDRWHSYFEEVKKLNHEGRGD